jgi:hypothetical protein
MASTRLRLRGNWSAVTITESNEIPYGLSLIKQARLVYFFPDQLVQERKVTYSTVLAFVSR